MSELSATAPPAPEGSSSLRTRLTSESLARKVCVGVISEVILARLGVVAAIGGLIVSLTVEDAVADFVRRRKWDRRTLWFVALLIWLLDHAEEALAKVGLLRRRERETAARASGVPAASVLAAGALVVGAFSAADAVAGRSLVAHRTHTFFSGGTRRHPVVPRRGAVAFRLPSGVDVSAPSPVRVTYAASATRSGRSIALTCSPASGSTFAIGKTTVSCAAGGSSRSFDVIVRRVPGPLLVLPTAVLRVEAADASGSPATFAAHSSRGAVVSCSPRSGSSFALGRTLVRCTARRGGAETRGSFAVLVVDSTAPSIATRPLVAASTTTSSATVTYGVTAHDAVDGAVIPRCIPGSGSSFPVGRTTVTCTATDASGNRATRTFVVAVAHTAVPVPALRLPAPMTVEAAGADGAVVSYAATATDKADGKLAPDCSPASGTTFALGRTTVSCSVTNSHGKNASGTFSVTVVDSTPPAISAQVPDRTEATSKAGAIVDFTAAATDQVTANVTASCSPASGSTFPIGTTTLACTATDDAGNTANRSFQVVVYDGPPTLGLKPSLRLRARDASGVVWKYTAPTASDAVDGPIPSTCTPPSGSLFPLGDSTLTCTVTDSAGNTVTKKLTVTVADETPPTVTVPSSPVTAPYDTAVDYAKYVRATDNVDGAVTPTCSPPSGSRFFEGDHTVSCTATDKAGNTSAPVTWVVHVAPVIR